MKGYPFINSTEIPEYIRKQQSWGINGDYLSHLSLGYIIADTLQKSSYLVLNTGYGTFADSLFEKQKKVKCTDSDEHCYDVMSDRVQQHFRIVDITRSSIWLGLFDNVVSSQFSDIYNLDVLPDVVNFICKHSNFFVALLFIAFQNSSITWIDEFTKHQFNYNDELVNNVIQKLHNRTNLNLKNLLIFQNQNPIVEVYG